MDNKANEAKSEKAVREEHLNRLRANCCLKTSSIMAGILVPFATMYALGLFAFGIWTLKDEPQCYSVEHPNYKQYEADPTESDP